MDSESKVEYLIVDTSAFIKNAALQEIGNKIITEPSVVDEIKSKRQLKRLVVLPYDLEVKDAYPEDIKFVTDFSKKTGDYPSLSATDIKVIALTYRFERERVGESHLRKEPQIKKEVIDSSVHRPDEQAKNLVGFYLPEGKKGEGESEDEGDDDNDEDLKNTKQESNDSENKTEDHKLNRTSESSSSESIDNQDLVTANDVSNESDAESDYNTAGSEEEVNNVTDLNEKFKNLNCDPTELEVECGDNITIDDILKPVQNNENDEGIKDSYEEEDDDEDDDQEEEQDGEEDDDSGWITPKNIKSVKRQMNSGLIKEKPATVACLTMDYAMQNVLMQIGLNVASIEGKVIKQMRSFILRCYTCFKTTGIVTKIFCPHCGNKTLKKVAVSLDDEGKQRIHINFKKPLTSKGKKFSLPTFQGGKHACNPLLFEDQPMPDQRPTKLGRAKNDPLNDDYIAGYSPFIMRDVNSRAAMLGIKSSNTFKHWMRKNPNEARRHRK